MIKLHPAYRAVVRQRLPFAEAKRFELMPDTIPYIDTLEQYRQQWAAILDSKRGGYLFTNDYQVTRVGFFRSFFERLRGWFGFENRCDPMRVQMSLMKYAYYGYTRGYHADLSIDFSQLPTAYQFPVEMSRHLASSRSHTVSCQLQEHLKTFYQVNHSFLRPSFWLRQFSFEEWRCSNFHGQYVFGTAIFRDLYQNVEKDPSLLPLVAKLDIQNNDMLEQLVNEIDQVDTSCDLLFIMFPDTTVALRYAERLFQEKQWGHSVAGKMWNGLRAISGTSKTTYCARISSEDGLRLAVALNSNFYKRVDGGVDFAVKHYLSANEYARAYRIVVDQKESHEAVEFIVAHPHGEALKQSVPQDSALGKAVASAMMRKATSRSFLGHTAAYADFAQMVDSHIVEAHPNYFFHQYVTNGQYDQAYALFMKVPTKSVFEKADCDTLAKHFHTSGEEAYEQGLSMRESDQWQKTSECYKSSRRAKKKAATLAPWDKAYCEDANVHLRLCAQLLFDSPITAHSSRLDQLDQVIKKYNKAVSKEMSANLNEDVHLRQQLILALFERVEILRSACLSTYVLQRSGYGEQAKFDQSCEPHYRKAQADLETIIQILGTVKKLDEQQTKQLAKAHFELAEWCKRFELGNHQAHYKKADQLISNNPFYALRCSEEFRSHEAEKKAYQERGLRLMVVCGFKSPAKDYGNWYDERWLITNDRITTREMGDIHSYRGELKPASRFSIF